MTCICPDPNNPGDWLYLCDTELCPLAANIKNGHDLGFGFEKEKIEEDDDEDEEVSIQ